MIIITKVLNVYDISINRLDIIWISNKMYYETYKGELCE